MFCATCSRTGNGDQCRTQKQHQDSSSDVQGAAEPSRCAHSDRIQWRCKKRCTSSASFRSDAFCRRDLLHCRFPQPIDRTELAQEQVFSVLTHARTIIQNAFADSLLHEQLMIGIGEAMRFVADPLQQPQRARIRRQVAAATRARPIDFLVLFCQTDDRQFVQAQAAAIRGTPKKAGPLPPSTMIRSGRRTATNWSDSEVAR